MLGIVEKLPCTNKSSCKVSGRGPLNLDRLLSFISSLVILPKLLKVNLLHRELLMASRRFNFGAFKLIGV